MSRPQPEGQIGIGSPPQAPAMRHFDSHAMPKNILSSTL